MKDARLEDGRKVKIVKETGAGGVIVDVPGKGHITFDRSEVEVIKRAKKR